MFKAYNSDGNLDTALPAYLNTTSSMQSQSLIVAEWNLNIAENIDTLGNYRHDPAGTAASSTFVAETSATSNPTWYGATDAKVVVAGGAYDNNTTQIVPQAFISTKQKTKYLYSLEDCFGKFRPRSGINKSVFFPGRKINYGVGNPDQGNGISGQYANRPRYYMPDMNDQFKYWSSYRTDVQSGSNVELGISSKTKNGSNKYNIKDAAPFVVYGDKMAANRVIIKMQTNVGDVDFSTYFGGSDPFYGYANSTTPSSWRVDYLDSSNAWQTLWTAPSGYQVPSDGSVELMYGFQVPDTFKDSFNYAGKYASASSLPVASINGYAYLVESLTGAGTFYIWSKSDNSYHNYDATPTWFVGDKSITARTPLATQLVGTTLGSEDPTGRVSLFPQYQSSGITHYREFQYINGLRIVVNSMNTPDSSFDLIELSARLSVNLTDKTSNISIKKSASDLGQTGLPVGQLLVSTGSLSLFDYDKAFTDNNPYSIIAQFALNSRFKPIRKMRVKPPKKSKSSSSYIQIKAFDVLKNINNQDYYVPVKTMYVDGFPEIGAPNRTVVINLRDLYFYFESLTAPELFIPNCSLSFAITTLMDSIGFSNYKFMMADTDKDPTIPFFFVAPNTTIAQVLNELAVSFQAAMFLDESNNFVVMYKNYLLPSLADRDTDLTIYGSDDSHTNGAVKNSQTYDITAIAAAGGIITYTCNNNFVIGQHVTITGASSTAFNLTNAVVATASSTNFTVVSSATGSTSTAKVKISPALANILDIKTEQDRVFNDGKITYASRYIQKALPNFKSQNLQDKDVIWKYKPVLLWEISPPENSKPANEQVKNQSGYVLTALALKNDLIGGEHDPTNNKITLPYVVEISDKLGTTTINQTAIINNVIDFGESIYWMPRYSGYFHANGEIIRYDAVEYTVSINSAINETTVWITSPQDYQKYFAKVAFGGKIYPTGRVKIYAEPYYELLFDTDGVTPLYDSVTGIQLSRMKLGDVVKHGRGQFGTLTTNSLGHPMPTAHSAGIVDDSSNFSWTAAANKYGCLMDSRYLVNPDAYNKTSNINFAGIAGKGTSKSFDTFAKKTKTNGIIKNLLSANNTSETEVDNFSLATPGNVQASALIIQGAKPVSKIGSDTFAVNPMDFISYVTKPLNNNFKHVGTRVRIIGSIVESKTNNVITNPDGNVTYYKGVGASSGGLAVGINPNTNHGYYFEIAALTTDTVNSASGNSTINNVFFYKIGRNKDTNTDAAPAIPQLLWTGVTNILIDDGNFTGQSRYAGQDQVTVYDLAIEHEPYKVGNNASGIKFYLYINDKLIATVVDSTPLSQTINSDIALFVRGNSKLMFENVYAITSNYSDNPASLDNAPLQSMFNTQSLNNSNIGFRKYSMSQAIQNLFLFGLHPSNAPKYTMYYEEFGTIMREVAYVNAKYDKAYPALTAKIAPTFNDIQGYIVVGFTASAYSAEFLIVNTTDTNLKLDESTGNFLRIQGVTFTQESQNQLTVDDFFGKKTDFSNPQRLAGGVIDSPYSLNATYSDIKNSRMTFGKNAFNLDATYIQDQDTASDLMQWIASKIMQPRLAIGLSLYGNPTIQLGDVVEVQYNIPNEIAIEGTRFVVYSIQYDRDNSGPSMIVYLTEVTA